MTDTTVGDVAKWGAIMLGMILAVPVVLVLSNQAPAVLIVGLLVGFLAWAGVRSGVLANDDEEATESAADPLTTLQERYAAGELTETEFERRLDRILESDELVREAGGAQRQRGEATRERPARERPATERDREPATERE